MQSISNAEFSSREQSREGDIAAFAARGIQEAHEHSRYGQKHEVLPDVRDEAERDRDEEEHDALNTVKLHEGGILSGKIDNDGHDPDVAEGSHVLVHADIELFIGFIRQACFELFHQRNCSMK